MGNITIQGDLTGDVPGGEVGGASNLTTVGAIPYVSAAGILNQTANLSFDVANNRLVLGSATVQRFSTDLSLSRASAGVLQVGDGGSNANGYLSASRIGVGTSTWADGGVSYSLNIDTGGSVLRPIRITSSNVDASIDFTNTASGGSRYNLGSTATGSGAGRGFAIYDATSGGTALLIAATTRNLIVGATTDSNFKLDVAASGSAGTARFYGGSGVTASTKVVVQAGGGQSGNLQEWQAANGGVRASVGSVGDFIGSSYDNGGTWEAGSSLNRLSNTYRVQWSSTGSYAGAADLSLSRASAGVLQVGDGGANANGTVRAANVGIGASSATVPLYAESTGSLGIMQIKATSSSGYSTIDFIPHNSSVTKGGLGYGNSGTGANWADKVLLWTYNVDLGLSANAVNNLHAVLKPNGNLLIGTTTDSNFKLDVAASGSAGTMRVYDATATTGTTRMVVRAGAGQSTTNLQEWQNSAGTVLGSIDSTGRYTIVGSGTSLTLVGNNGYGSPTITATGGILALPLFGFSWAGALDLSLSRASAGVLQVGDGAANANGAVSLTRSQHAGVLVAALPAAAAGNAGSIQYVTDANATTIGSTVAGGGANKVMVWSDGAAWKIFAS